MTDCKVCNTQEAGFIWTDTHGVGICSNCGCPYQIYFYDEKTQEPIKKEPECLLKESGIELAKRYFVEFGRKVFPAQFDMGFLGGRSETYSGASKEDVELWNEWMEKQ